jgi:serine/threonine-protein kinase RsbW
MTGNMTDVYSLEIDSDPRLIPTARMFAATVARLVGCPEDTVYDVKIAVSEACTNAVLAHRDDDSPILLRVEELDDALVYEVSDAGPGFAYQEEDPREVFRRAATGSADEGMGIALIRALFPTAEFEPSDQGTVVRFSLSRS